MEYLFQTINIYETISRFLNRIVNNSEKILMKKIYTHFRFNIYF